METTMSDTTTADTTADTTTETAAPASLQMSTLFQAAQVIQVAAERGAFRAEELSQVGGVYDAIVNFLQASGAIAPVADASATTDTTADSQATDATETDATAPADA
jgi:predicted deacylase